MEELENDCITTAGRWIVIDQFSSQGKRLYEMTRYILPVMRLSDNGEPEDVSPPHDLNSDCS